MHYRHLLLLCVLMGAFLPTLAFADIAPPEQPRGGTIGSTAQTLVRMQAEQVVLTVEERSAPQTAVHSSNWIVAHVDAHFQMRNLGNTEETLQVRFPLQTVDGLDAFRADDIQDFQVEAGGVQLQTKVITQPMRLNPSSDPIRWAAFTITFPVKQDLDVHVRYTHPCNRLLSSGALFVCVGNRGRLAREYRCCRYYAETPLYAERRDRSA